jgi:hypothetical protein
LQTLGSQVTRALHITGWGSLNFMFLHTTTLPFSVMGKANPILPKLCMCILNQLVLNSGDATTLEQCLPF